jgi:hypothetical protein
MEASRIQSRRLAVLALLFAAAISGYAISLTWREYPATTAVGLAFFLLGGGIGLRHPRGALTYSLTLGAVLGMFIGTGVMLIASNVG